MNSGLTIFALGIVGLAATAAMVAPDDRHASSTTAEAAPAPSAGPNITVQKLKPPPRPAPQPGGMVSHSISQPAVTVRMSQPQPPIVAIPRIPGPADMMVEHGDRELRRIRSYTSNEACDEALATVRRTISNAFCVSTTPPPPPPEHGYLVEVDTLSNEVVGLQTYPSMAACQSALAARPATNSRQGFCTPRLH